MLFNQKNLDKKASSKIFFIKLDTFLHRPRNNYAILNPIPIWSIIP